MGRSFQADETLYICAIYNVSGDHPTHPKKLTGKGSNNAFPSTNPDGNSVLVPSNSFPIPIIIEQYILCSYRRVFKFI